MSRMALGIYFSARLATACISVPGDKILVREFAQSITEFALADQEKVVSFAPLPGTQRNFTGREVQALAIRVGVKIDANSLKDVCFIREVHELTDADFQAALIRATKGRASIIEILDHNRAALPVGRLEFPLTQVTIASTMDPETPVLWRGRLVSSSGRSYPTWVKARIVAETRSVFANVTLVKGQIITPGQVELRVAMQFPFVQGQLTSASEVVGKLVKHDIAAGQRIPANSIEEGKEVETGETVRVDSTNGMAQIHFEARALTGGRKGDTILVQNPENGRSFRALITGKERVEAKTLNSHPAVKN